MPMSCFEAQEALVSLLNRLSREWIEFDTSNPTENTPLYLLCSTGMLEMHVSGRAWGSSTALDFEAWLVGLWIDATRRSILPDELRRAVPAWAGQAVAVQLAPRMRVRLTLDGKAAQDVVRQQGSAGFLEYICSRPVPGRVRVRILGNQGPAPGAVHSDSVTTAVIEKLDRIAQAVETLGTDARPLRVITQQSGGVPPAHRLDDNDGMYTAAQIADLLGIPPDDSRTRDLVRKRLENWRAGRPAVDWWEREYPGPRTARYVYRLSAVWSEVEDLRRF